MCILFAVCYFIAGVTKLWNNFWVLMLGRFLSGVATSLLFSTFEAWMVSEHHAKKFDSKLLEHTFALCTLGNGMVAVAAGQVAQFAADSYGYVAPFIVCLVPLALVGIIVSRTWRGAAAGPVPSAAAHARPVRRTENYGDSKIDVVGAPRSPPAGRWP